MIWMKPIFFVAIFCLPFMYWLMKRQSITKQHNCQLFGFEFSPWHEKIKRISFCLTLFFYIFALAEPHIDGGKKELRTEAREIVFLLDVSRSMLVDDLLPNRLERAKQEILNAIPELQGNELALVTFAGDTVIRSPLTVDYNYFAQSVSNVRINDSGRGGTLIGDALREILRVLVSDDNADFMDVILLTDGDDQESFPLEAARKLASQGGTLFIFGLGDADSNSPIPTSENSDDIINYQGEDVYSTVNSALLREMAESTDNGHYIPIANGSFDLGGIYATLSQRSVGRETKISSDTHYISIGWYFILMGLLFNLIYFLYEYKWNYFLYARMRQYFNLVKNRMKN